LGNRSWIAALLLILLGLTIYVPVVSVEPVPPVVPASGTFQKYGPRVDRLIFRVSGGVTMECYDFEAGLVDVMDCAAPPERWEDWLADPEITMGEYEEFRVIYVALNNMRWPIGHGDQLPYGWTKYPAGYLSNHNLSLWNGDPTSSDLPVGNASKTWIDYSCQRCLDSRWFRRGLAHMVDRASQVAYMAGAGVALDPSLFWPALKTDWEHPNVTEIYDQEGYITKYDYDLGKARACFENGGFKDWDNDSAMEYSPTHDGTKIEELPTLQFYTRVDDDHRLHGSMLLSCDMHRLGIPHFLDISPYGVICTQVWALYDYDIYVEYRDWSLTPDFYAEWFHSRMDIYPDPWGENEHRYHSEEFDYWADLFTTSSSAEEAKPYCYKMQEIIHRDVAAIPFYCYVGYVAHRTHYGYWTGEEKYAGLKWQGFVNELGLGFHSFWTHLNAHTKQGWSWDVPGFEKGGTLRQGLSLDPEFLDIMDSIYRHERLVLARIYENLIKFNPYDPTRLIPWLCENYTVGKWWNGTKWCSAINFTLIPSVLWQDGRPMTAKDVEFSFWFTRECKSANYAAVKDYNSSVTYENTPRPGVQTIEIRFNVPSWLAPYWCSGVYIIPKHVWEPVGVKGSAAYIPEDYDTVFGTGPFRFYKEGIVGKVDRVPREYLYLEPNPLYFRKKIWPDVCYGKFPEYYTPGLLDGYVTGLDFAKVAELTNIFKRVNPDGTWPDPPGAWDPHCDVNEDGKIGVGDLMEIGLHYGEPWPPPWYIDC